MINDARESSVMFVASWAPLEKYFDGYFFHGSDYVFGQDGVRELEEAFNFQVKSGLDGCYVYMARDGDSLVFGNDFSGYKALYYYHDGEQWAVSDSFSKLVDELRNRGLAGFPDYAQLGAICSTNSTNNQLFSWSTPLQRIKLLPRGAMLRVLPHSPSVEYNSVSVARNYTEGLADHVSLWVSRFATILGDSRLEMSLDITGGVDSRTNFALANAAHLLLGSSSFGPRFTCASSAPDSPDIQIANELCATYGYTLNQPNRVRPALLDAEEGYQLWRDYSLGVYYPLVIPRAGRRATRLHISGGGGEVHRDYYAGRNVEEFAAGHARRNMYSWLGIEAGRAGLEAARFISATRQESPLRSNYREYRHRYHVGRTPRQGVSFTPLDSKTAEMANLATATSRGGGAHFNFDILASVNPDLLHMPYDSPKKTPSAQIIEELVPADFESNSTPGHVWGVPDDSKLNAGPSLGQSARIQPFIRALGEASEDQFVQDFCGEEKVQEAQRLAEVLATGGSIGNPVHGHPISAVLTAHLVSPRH